MNTALSRAPFHPRRILVPLDFSGQSRQAFRCAVPLAEKFGASILLVHVIPPPVYAATDLALAPPNAAAQRAAARRRLTTTATAGIPPGVKVRAVIREGHPAREILAVARRHKVGLVVISTKGRTGIRRLLLGSTAEYVVRHALCPVLAVRRQSD